MLDIFNQDAFSVTSLTEALRDLKYRPNRLGSMGLFETDSVSTLSVSIERVGDVIKLLKPTPRGTVGEAVDTPKRNLRNLTLRHFQRPWSVYADEVQGVRAFGTETQLETVQGIVSKRMAQNLGDFELTEEYTRIGAIGGIVTYADGSTLNLFTEMGMAEPATINFNLAAASPAEAAILSKCVALIRSVRKSLGGIGFDHIHAFVGDAFFDALLTSKEVRDTYKHDSQSEFLRTSYVGPNRGSNPIFQFGGIVWENYGAIDDEGDGALLGIASDEARFVPVGVPGLFKTYYGPADYLETVNTLGERLYAKQIQDQWGKSILGEMQSNPLTICTRPNALRKGTRT